MDIDRADAAKKRGSMKPSRMRLLAATLAVTPCLVAAALGQAQQPSPEAVQSELSDILSFVGGGLVEPREHPPLVARDGDTYRISIPLPGLTAPPNAAIDAAATLRRTGVWDITSLTLPASGTMPMTRTGTDAPGTLSFSIRQQAIHARVDPTLSAASPFAAELGTVTVQTDSGAQRTQQTIERYLLQGTLTGDDARHVNLQTQSSAANWRIKATDKAGATASSRIRSAAGSFNVEGLDRVQAQRLMLAARAVATGIQAARAEAARPRVPGTPAPDRPPPLSPALRAQLRALVDASAGLLTRLEAEDSFQDIIFEALPDNGGSMGQVRVALASEARNDRLNAQLDVTMNDLTLSAVPVDLAAYLPHHIEFKPALSGVHIGQLMRLLRDATAADPDQSALRDEAMALLNDSNARIGIDRVFFDSGPLRLQGSARLRPQTGGMPGIDIHLATTGLDALIAQAQDNPRVQPMLPLVFLAKGMARSQGDSLVWDISLSDGVFTVNGTPIGQSPANR